MCDCNVGIIVWVKWDFDAWFSKYAIDKNNNKANTNEQTHEPQSFTLIIA